MRYYIIFFLAVLFVACDADTREELLKPVSLPADMVSIDFVDQATQYEVVSAEELADKYDLQIIDPKVGGGRWSDDVSRETYGTVSCGKGGTCTAVTSPGGGKAGIGCLDANGEPLEGTKIGAWRDV